jgi:hypothetical protein
MREGLWFFRRLQARKRARGRGAEPALQCARSERGLLHVLCVWPPRPARRYRRHAASDRSLEVLLLLGGFIDRAAGRRLLSPVVRA